MGGQAVGAHVSSSGGIWTAVGRGAAIGAEAIQIFGSAPQSWRQTKHTPEGFARFREERQAAGIREVWLHNSYLANLASDDDVLWERSIESVTHALGVAHEVAAGGVVLHTGSHRGLGVEAVLERVATALGRIFAGAPDDVVLALENAAGQGGTIGATFAELGTILRAADEPRLRVCLDTCHAFAAGYDIAHEQGMRATLVEFEAEIGLARLAVVHANDSKAGLGGNRDRHENIGDGEIGRSGFATILGTPELAALTFLLEVPGIEGDGPDLENVQRLKAIRDEVDP